MVRPTCTLIFFFKTGLLDKITIVKKDAASAFTSFNACPGLILVELEFEYVGFYGGR